MVILLIEGDPNVVNYNFFGYDAKVGENATNKVFQPNFGITNGSYGGNLERDRRCLFGLRTIDHFLYRRDGSFAASNFKFVIANNVITDSFKDSYEYEL